MRTRTLLPLALLLLLAACDRGGGEAPPERSEAQLEAARRACIAAELVALSEDEVETLEGTMGGEHDEMAQITRQAQSAALEFARVLQQHAQLRRSALAHADTALNHVSRSADSARHAETAVRFSPRRAERGTVEANAVAEYERRFGRIAEDPDHRCNWDI